MANLDQQRAGFALSKIQGLKADRDKYLTELRKLSARLHTSGLGQSVAFYLSAGAKSPEATICDWLAQWLRKRGIYESPGGAGLMSAITSDTTNYKYRQASVESRALATWLKRFAEAFLESPVAANGDAPAGQKAEAQP
ncbi:MAG: type III-B CRISPR module-associated protein Cmr5 [Thermoanaerobaculia bacterium]